MKNPRNSVRFCFNNQKRARTISLLDADFNRQRSRFMKRWGMYERGSQEILIGTGEGGRQEVETPDHAGAAGHDAGCTPPQKGTIGIYSITNRRNGKRYIGSAAKCMRRRWFLHLHQLRKGEHHSRHLQGAWDADGEASFTLEVLFVCQTEECLSNEQRFIDSFQSSNAKFGYNIQPVAGSALGTVKSAECRAKIGAGNKGKVRSAAHRAAVGDARRGKALSVEHRAKIGAAFKGRKLSPESIEKLRTARAGQVFSAETRAKMSATHKARQLNPETRQKPPSQETRAKLSAALRGKRFSDEHRANISKSKKGTKASEEAKKRMGDAHRGTTYSEESKVRMRAAQLLSWQKRKANGPVMASEETRRKMSDAQLRRNQRARELKLSLLDAVRPDPISA